MNLEVNSNITTIFGVAAIIFLCFFLISYTTTKGRDKLSSNQFFTLILTIILGLISLSFYLFSIKMVDTSKKEETNSSKTETHIIDNSTTILEQPDPTSTTSQAPIVPPSPTTNRPQIEETVITSVHDIFCNENMFGSKLYIENKGESTFIAKIDQPYSKVEIPIKKGVNTLKLIGSENTWELTYKNQKRISFSSANLVTHD